jgi:hypothetical protein
MHHQVPICGFPALFSLHFGNCPPANFRSDDVLLKSAVSLEGDVEGIHRTGKSSCFCRLCERGSESRLTKAGVTFPCIW